MKRLALLYAIIFLGSACKKDCGDNLSACLQEKVELYKKDATENPCPNYGIKEYLFEGKLVYVFGSPACLADGVDFVLNAQCDTICNLGGFMGNSKCSGKSFYDNAKLKRVIWEP